jgi:hypothetical protein
MYCTPTTYVSKILLILSWRKLFVFPEFNIMLYDKHSESDYFFSSTKIRIVFSATLGNHIPLFKLNGRSLSWQDKTCLEHDNDKIVLQFLFCANSSNVIHQQTWWFMVIYGDLWWFMVIYGTWLQSTSSLVEYIPTTYVSKILLILSWRKFCLTCYQGV